MIGFSGRPGSPGAGCGGCGGMPPGSGRGISARMRVTCMSMDGVYPGTDDGKSRVAVPRLRFATLGMTRGAAVAAHGFVVGFDEGSLFAVRPAFEFLFEGDGIEDLVELGDVFEDQRTAAVGVGPRVRLVLVFPEAAIDVVGDA